ncbi:MAG TPA: dTDP-4-dehydrorhamnose 3,5-epimerase family protein, partial [Steroidobacteraceae bacterium]|nr:dTDP-4-dehydrorhamnose 3,5-epimerase family protein [Steroidobacteraceae bacterium]
MIIHDTPLPGAYTLEMQRLEDERGFFARSFCGQEFAARGLPDAMPQSSVSFNTRRGTLRGLHYQAEPHAEDKLVRCTAWAVYDVIVDLRPGSATRRRWFGTELSAENHRSL